MTGRRRRIERSLTQRIALLAVLVMACATAVTLTPERAEAADLLITTQAETMTSGGGCTGIEDTHVVYYCNGDSTYTTYSFSQAGRYRVDVRGASTAANRAGISVYIAEQQVAALGFTGTDWTEQSAVFDLASGGEREIRFTLEDDTGQNDTLIDRYELWFEGETPPPPPAPNPPATGAFTSGEYRNLFQEWDPSLTDAAITEKLDTYWDAFFTSTDDTERLYYPSGSNANGPLAYIKDTGNDDVRSEGMSYGMMIAVQMDRKPEFDALWNWAQTHMQHDTGPRAGYFCWQASESGSCTDNNPATDGEEYFATALFFAGHRWGDGTGIYEYTREANHLLDVMLHKEDMNGGVVESVTNMFDATHKMPVFVPYASAAQFSNPSYHLPAFYELWARWADGYEGNQAADRQFWRDAANVSRQYFVQATHPTTGLNPDYAEFDGRPNHTGDHGDFRFDAWRTSVNWAVDYAWWAADESSKTLTDRLQAFFDAEGINAYANQYSLAGNPLSSDRSPGLIASNGAASLSATHARSWKFVEALWNLEPPTGRYRYYDGLLNYLGLLHASGNFRIHQPGDSGPPDTEAPTAPTGLTSTAASSSSVTLAWNASTDNVGVTGYTGHLDGSPTGAPGCVHVTTTGCTVTGLSPETSYSFTVRARDAAGNVSAPSSSLAVTTAAPSTTAPAAPSGLTATASGPTDITLSWTDNSADETGFRIERRTGADGSWALLTTTAPDVTTHTDTGLTGGTSYRYRVRATNAAGDSAFSDEAEATAPGVPVTRNAYQQIAADTYDAASGVTTQQDDGGTVVHLTGSGSRLVLRDVEFGPEGARGVRLRVAGTVPGANVHLRLDSATASPACTVYPDGNGSWHLKSNTCWPRPTGTRDVHVTVTGPVTLHHLVFTR
ncbi:glycosyl hydrolase family 8 [Streptomyces sp. ACA25]|uniref:glycosyl hydrolase family 8 n=1 Tax=Streptomyces sp. ACA25 TaxID=3022596 RepID=UPI00230786AE|nr:glycosyl hydrolase family 8 [Streptomyces sp. ACA25]MDB1087590.1 glycosyl hydrolase family 8 [Streptomyces sp. ACA25]